jgi:hypothetical protein
MRSVGPVLKRAAPAAAPVVGPVRDPNTLPWKTVDVSKSRFLGLLTGTRFNHAAWSQAVKEAGAGQDFAQQALARTIESRLGTPPVISGPYDDKNQQSKEWVKARSAELKWQTFARAAREGTMPEYRTRGFIGGIFDKAVTNKDGHLAVANEIKGGFLGPDFKPIASSPTASGTTERFVSADGQREFRHVTENGKSRMEFLTIESNSVSAVRLHLD